MTLLEQRLLRDAILFLEILKGKYFPDTKHSEIDRLIDEYKQYIMEK
jgi:hypothetical protein